MKKFLTFFLIFLAFSILVFLGGWQLQRLQWKESIIDRLEIEYAKNPEQVRYTLNDLSTTSNMDLPLLYGSIEGTFDYTREILVGPKPLDGEIGYLVITPLKIISGGNILVNRGWVPQEQRNDLEKSHVNGNIIVTGIFRQPDWNSFTPNNSPENNIWTKLDIDQIAEKKGISDIAPLMLYAENSSREFIGLSLQEERWFPRNKHKQYAIFWFSMAGILLLIFGLYWKQQKS